MYPPYDFICYAQRLPCNHILLNNPWLTRF